MSAPSEWTTFEAMVSASTGKPFVQFTAGLGDEPVFSVKMPPSVVTAMGLRAIQSAIEAERDAGLVAYILERFGPQIGMEGDAARALAAAFLSGMRQHREQFDAEAGTMRPLSGDDPSEATGGSS